MARSSDAPFPLSLVRDKSFQVRQIRRVALLAAFFVVQSTLLLGAFHHELLGRLVAGNAPLLFASEDIGSLAARVPSVGDVMGRWLAIMLGLNALVTVAIGTWIVRRLGSPILAMRRVLDEIGDGNLEVRLRAGDAEEFDELAVALNRALASVQAHVADARAATAVLDAVGDQPLPDARELRGALERCRERLDWFDGSARAPAGAAGEGAPDGAPGSIGAGRERRRARRAAGCRSWRRLRRGGPDAVRPRRVRLRGRGCAPRGRPRRGGAPRSRRRPPRPRAASRPSCRAPTSVVRRPTTPPRWS